MLEKIGLPPKPSLRGNTWVVDASHCQGCSTQFSFINRKHHCRRCGGIFCGSCTQQRMLLRGQGDSPVRICEPCKKLEEAARFEMRHGHKSRGGGSKLTPKNEDEVLNQILGTDGKLSIQSGQESSTSVISDLLRDTSSASCSSSHRESIGGSNREGDILRSLSVDSHSSHEMDSTSPDELRQQALEEKKKYRILKGEGKPEEALKAFKRGKELERQAGALEIALRKNRRKAMSSSSLAGMKKKGGDEIDASGKRSKLFSQVGEEEKDDLTSELRELGWTDADVHDADKKPAKMTLEGELSSLLGEVQKKSNSGKGTGGIDKTQVFALKKKALMFKREGKLSEAKEELKKAKILEKQLEEQEFLAEAEDSDDELSALIRSMDDDKSADLLVQHDEDPMIDFQPLMHISDDYGLDNLDVMDEDMNDPEIALALKSLGWTEDSDHPDESLTEVVPMDREALLEEILSLKKEAVNQKRAGNVAEAMTRLKKAKLLEKDLESLPPNLMTQKVSTSQNAEKSSNLTTGADDSVGSIRTAESKLPPKSKLMIQKELLALKKKALALRREGRLDESEEELKKGNVLERQLEEIENASKVRAVNVVNKDSEPKHGIPVVSGTLTSGEEGDEGDVTEQDMHDPALLSLLTNLGWKDEDAGPISMASRPKLTSYHSENTSDSSVTEATVTTVKAPRRSKAEIQRELLGLKRKALALRRQGDTEGAEEVLEKAKVLEAQIAEMEVPKKEAPLNSMMDTQFVVPAPLISERNHGNTEIEYVDDVREGVAKLSVNSRNEAAEAPPRTPAVSMSSWSHPTEENNMSLTKNPTPLADKRIAEHAGKSPPSINPMDLLTGISSKSSHLPFEEVEGKGSFSTNIFSRVDPEIHTGGKRNLDEVPEMKDDNLSGKQEKVASLVKKIPTDEANVAPGFESLNDQSSLKQEILALKRKAVALKREGKLVEAREELRQAKILEKNIIDNPQPAAGPTDGSVSTSNDSSVGKGVVERITTNVAPKQMSGRDRFKLQQETLAHKRQAMKLRREGRMEEAEAEFELAKALEAQLEEQTANDSVSTSKSEAMDDVGIEALLDPQLLSALKAIGIQDAEPVSRAPKRPESAKASAEMGENSSQEKSMLEERIKAEKLKALNLKRAGKQVEALDALRRAKQFEKKLSSLPS